MYNLSEITPENALAVIKSEPGLKQPQLLDRLRGPLEYYAEDGVNPAGEKVTAGDVIPRPFQDLVEALRKLRFEGKADFTPKGSAGGWR